jgi:hypothetical protein
MFIYLNIHEEVSDKTVAASCFDPKKCTGTAPILEGVTLAKSRSRGCKHDIKRYTSMRF